MLENIPLEKAHDFAESGALLDESLSACEPARVSSFLAGVDLMEVLRSFKNLHIHDGFKKYGIPLLNEPVSHEEVIVLPYDLDPARSRIHTANERAVASKLGSVRLPFWVPVQMLQNQLDGKSGPLLTNDYPNIFYLDERILLLAFRKYRANYKYRSGWWIEVVPRIAINKYYDGEMRFARCRVFTRQLV